MLTAEQIEILRKTPVRKWDARQIVDLLSMAECWYDLECSQTLRATYWENRAKEAEKELDAIRSNLSC